VNAECVRIPLSVANIDPKTFQNCHKITTVICDPKWLNCFDRSKLKQVIIQENVPEIKKDAFKDCVNLEFIKIPSSVIKIDEGFFNDYKI